MYATNMYMNCTHIHLHTYSYSQLYSEFTPTISQLVALLREVKYLEQMGENGRTLPESAAAVFEKNETYRMFLQVTKRVCVCVCGRGEEIPCMYI